MENRIVKCLYSFKVVTKIYGNNIQKPRNQEEQKTLLFSDII